MKSKIALFLLIGICALGVNLSVFSLYIKFFSPAISSFLAFSTTISFNFFGHKKFLWYLEGKTINLPPNFLLFYLGYSFSMIVNVGIVYFLEGNFTNLIYLQFIGIVVGSIFNFLVSKWVFTQKIL
jgi:putative flippase GtrA